MSANDTIHARVQHPFLTAEALAAANPVLLAGEVVYESDTRRHKIGDGTTPWNELPYAGSELPDAIPAAMIGQDPDHRFVSDDEKSAWNSNTSVMHPVSYADLVALRDSGRLRPGHCYRITDFVTTVANDAEARSAGHPFDIIVLATDAGTLSEEARAAVNESHAEYFAKANLSAWKVWYCLDNDTARFQWADETNGRGVVYRLIDEWQNDCPYDFKNVQFKRYRAIDESPSGCLQDLDGLYVGINANIQHVGIHANDFVWAYTFSFGDRRSAPTDASLIGFNSSRLGDGYGDKGYYGNNVILPSSCHLTVDDEQNSVFCLNNIVWFANNAMNQALMNGNHIDNECINMTLSGYGTYIMHDCRNIIMGDRCYANSFEGNCASIAMGDSCAHNMFGTGCFCNTFGSSCSGNTFGTDCYHNSFGSGCIGNTFGSSCGSNTFGYSCYRNTFGNNCWENTFGKNCSKNSFGNDCHRNLFGNNLHYLTVHEDVWYVSVVGAATDSSYVQHAQILNGTGGSSFANRLQIAFKADVKYCQFAGLDSSGILKIWTPADLV